MRDHHEQNRRSWNLATARHNLHKVDQAGFFRRGGSTLFPEELELLGPVDGLRLVHLQCNAGQDTLSLAALGARCTGVDISDEAIAFATQLAADSGIVADFLRADVYDWFDTATPASVDVVFCSYGALCWLSDLPRWAAGIARVLAPGGRLVFVEFHPFACVFDESAHVAWPYLNPDPFHEPGISDYVGCAAGALSPSGHRPLDDDATWQNPEPSVEWSWSIAEVLNGLLGASLQLQRMEEWGYSNGCDLLGCLERQEGNRWFPPEALQGIPMMWGLVAQRR